jgi:hypothetical protein
MFTQTQKVTTGDRAHRPVGVLGLQQMLDQPPGSRDLRLPLGQKIRPGTHHAQQTQFFEFGGNITTHG